MTKPVKTMQDINGSFTDSLKIGDLVDEEIVEYFLTVLPPKTWSTRIIQMGEPYSYENGQQTYLTLSKTSRGWAYAGTCHAGRIQNYY